MGLNDAFCLLFSKESEEIREKRLSLERSCANSRTRTYASELTSGIVQKQSYSEWLKASRHLKHHLPERGDGEHLYPRSPHLHT